MTERALLERLRVGERSAAGVAFERYGRLVYNVCLRVLENPESAQDAAQAVFLLLLRKGPHLGKGTILSNWLYRSAEWVAREALRTERRRCRREKKAYEMAQLEDRETWKTIRPDVDRALAGLPERWRAPVVLTYLEGRSRVEVARILGIPEGTVAGRLARALNALRRRLGRRREVLSASALAGLLAAHCMEASTPPAVLPAFLAAAKGLGASASAAATPAVHMMQAAAKAMFWTKVKTTAVAATTSAIIPIASQFIQIPPSDSKDYVEEL